MKSFPLYQVDSFTDQLFTGNPAGVCLLDESQPEIWMRALAAEMALSETAFLVRRGGDFDLRWFTPTTEVNLCGHATLASAHILFQTGIIPTDQEIRFHTRSGLLTASFKNGWIELNFPAIACHPSPPNEMVNAALGIDAEETFRTGENLLLVYAEEKQVRGLTPDFSSLAKSEPHGYIVTAPSTSPEFDFVSRFFAPRIGINEDPVTGSAHSSLGPYWQERLHKDFLSARQVSRRGGVLKVKVSGERVYISGTAVTVFGTQIQGG